MPLVHLFGEVGNGDQAVKWFEDRWKVYPLATESREWQAKGQPIWAVTRMPKAMP